MVGVKRMSEKKSYHSFTNCFNSTCVPSPIFIRRRLALHKYDPPDLVTPMDTVVANAQLEDTNMTDATKTPVKTRQLQEASAQGMLVDLAENTQESSPISLLSPSAGQELTFDDESDDDLL
jgi:hypothetical protein